MLVKATRKEKKTTNNGNFKIVFNKFKIFLLRMASTTNLLCNANKIATLSILRNFVKKIYFVLQHFCCLFNVTKFGLNTKIFLSVNLYFTFCTFHADFNNKIICINASVLILFNKI